MKLEFQCVECETPHDSQDNADECCACSRCATLDDLRTFAKHQDCTLRIQGPSKCASFKTTVFCHAPNMDTGTGHKSNNWFGAFGCSVCHDLIDGRTKRKIRSYANNRIIQVRLTQHEKDAAWVRGLYETGRIVRSYFKDDLPF